MPIGQTRQVNPSHGGGIYDPCVLWIGTNRCYAEILTEIPGHFLNGLVLTKDNRLIVASVVPAAIFEVDPATGAFSPIYEGAPLRNPEDVAIDNKGNIYILDSDFLRSFPDFRPSLYVIRTGSTVPELLHEQFPFNDVVDILLGSFA